MNFVLLLSDRPIMGKAVYTVLYCFDYSTIESHFDRSERNIDIRFENGFHRLSPLIRVGRGCQVWLHHMNPLTKRI